ncbi:MAG TPA: DMT family transporter [Burkholderiaceae bacterium]|nr:DMT family transporter [Burkholderiaceae bacterium]
MITLLISLVCSVAVSVLLKIARSRNLDMSQAIAVNYVLAAILCLAILHPSDSSLLHPDTRWWVLIALGVLLPSVFLAMAGAVRHAGIVLSDAAQRLSLIIPLTAAFLIFGEHGSTDKFLGIGMAFIALLCLLARPRQSEGSSETGRSIALLLCVWAGYGVIDILFKQMARSGTSFSSSLFASFVLAGVLMFIYMIARRTRWTARSVVAGIILGALNFSNIYFYLRAHQVFPHNPTLVFSAMNIGVISLGTVVGALIFRERLSWTNGAGIVLAIAAIVMLFPH